jgi:hypothetical protein
LLTRIEPTRFSFLKILSLQGGGMDPTPHVGMFNIMTTWKKRLVPMWALMSTLFVGYHFKVIPLACGMGICSNNCLTHKGWVYFFPQTHKTQIKRLITNPKNSIEKTKRNKKIKPTINK